VLERMALTAAGRTPDFGVVAGDDGLGDVGGLGRVEDWASCCWLTSITSV